jgi:DMSO/TMAO reductase YedYZ molybdopterin-dependent catalytic subunit
VRRRLPESDSGITPVSDLFTYHIFGTPTRLSSWQEDVGSYGLEVTGLVDRPLSLSLSQIREDFEPVDATMVLQCTTNVHWGRIQFSGARMLDVLQRAGVREEAWKVALHGADGFDTDLALDEIRRCPEAFLLAYSMNGNPIPPGHGFPIRATADGKYGFKWCKWLERLELVDYDFLGHYEGRRGWSDEGTRGRPVI